MLQIVQFLWMDFFISARLVRAFVCSYPMDGILRASEQCCCPVNRIPIEISRAFTVQSRLCYRKHSSLKHHPCFRAMINLQPCIRRPQCYSSGETAVLPFFDGLKHGLTFGRLLSQPLHFIWWFLFVTSLLSSLDTVCYASVLFSVSM